MKIFKKKKGHILLQVLMVSAIVATIATMVIRLSLAKGSVKQIQVTGNTAVWVVQGCLAEVEAIWTKTGAPPNLPYDCEVIKTVNGTDIKVRVTKEAGPSGGPSNPYKLKYTIDTTALDLLQN